MPALPPNKKKIRGWKIQARRVERWREAHLTPDWRYFEDSGRDYAKLYIDPWYRLSSRIPPARLRWDMLGALLDVQAAWAKAAQERKDIGYLAIWLF